MGKFTIEEIYNAADLLGYSSPSVDRKTRYANFINQHGVIVRNKLRRTAYFILLSGVLESFDRITI